MYENSAAVFSSGPAATGGVGDLDQTHDRRLSLPAPSASGTSRRETSSFFFYHLCSEFL